MSNYWHPQINTHPVSFQDKATVGTFDHANLGLEIRPPKVPKEPRKPIILEITVINFHASNTLYVSFDGGEHWITLDSKEDSVSANMYQDCVLVKGSAADTNFEYFGQYCYKRKGC
tara:strand:+ start:408 stop:755 length:348 start_codon:yes stop_codon:yes gene_type:complete